MAWRRDPATGEWEMIDSSIPDPMTQSTTQQEPDPELRSPSRPPPYQPPKQGEGYSHPGMGFMPLPVEETPSLDYAAPPDNANGYEDPDMQMIPPAHTGPGAGEYQNYDPAAYARWEQEVEARGNEVRETAVGCFEVEAGTNNILSRAPSGYKVN